MPIWHKVGKGENMASGIVCKVWNISGDTATKNAKANVGDSLEYILNEEKTKLELEMPMDMFNDPGQQLERECKYVANDIKTMEGAYVGTRNLISSNMKHAVEEMMQVKEFYEKKDGRAALHGMISLEEKESSTQNAAKLLQLCNDVVKELFENHQAIFAVHTNTDNLHVHFIINSVGLNGKKIHQNDKFIKCVVHPCINKYARKYGFSPNTEWEKERENNKTEYANLKARVRAVIDRAIEKSDSYDDFLNLMKEEGYIVRTGKNISVKGKEMDKAIRTHKLGSSYTKDCIVERIRVRKDAFQVADIHNRVMQEEYGNVYVPIKTYMKRYQDMSEREKRYAIRQLKLGKNPWQAQNRMNWQMEQIAKRLNVESQLVDLTEYYSKDGSLHGTLEGIIDAKKQVMSEKKEVRQQMQKYKVIFDIYSEMKSIEKKAYLYEYKNQDEYRVEFEHYRELTKRLENGYGKNVLEVAALVDECNEKILYCNAQIKVLSEHYRMVKKYGKEHGYNLGIGESLLDSMELSDAYKQKYQGIFDTDVSYIGAKEAGTVVRIVKYPKGDEKGRLTEHYEISVISDKGEILEQIEENIGSELQKNVIALEKKYDLRKCKKFTNSLEAKEYSKISNPLEQKGKELDKQKLSFTQAINRNSAKGKNGYHIICNCSDPAYTAAIKTNEQIIEINVYERDGNLKEVIQIPSIKNAAEKSEYAKILALQRKYGFSDNMISFESNEELQLYMKESTAKEEGRKEGRNIL